MHEAEEVRASLGELSPDFLLNAMHWRNALRSIDGGSILDLAREFMIQKRRRGYGILPAPGTPPKRGADD